MKTVLAVLLLTLMTLCLTACIYNPPEGLTKNPHTYKEILTFAKSIDPNATVSEEYTDILDEYNWPYREWEAVINGVNCYLQVFLTGYGMKVPWLVSLRDSIIE